MNLYYNASHPLEILKSLTIKTSEINKRNRGLSMSSMMLDSHGPFTFAFKQDCNWYGQFTQVQYGQFNPVDTLHKPEMFKGEHEWWSPTEVKFEIDDIAEIYFRVDSPGARIHPIKSKRIAEQLKAEYRHLFSEYKNPRIAVYGKLCFENDVDAKIRLYQRANKKFVVVYGANVSDDLTYGQAATRLGTSLMHALACAGNLDGETSNK